MVHIYFGYSQNGPGKVIKNLSLGLTESNIDFKHNSPLYGVSDGDPIVCLQGHNVMDSGRIKDMFIGPNICTLPIDNSAVMEQKYKKILVPSKWVYDLYSKWVNVNKIEIWPVGIDTSLFSDTSELKKEVDCLLYFKRRGHGELRFICDILSKFGQSYKILEYGKYSEVEFIDLLKKSKYSFVLDKPESQGIAIQEIMSCNIPIFCWDSVVWDDRGSEYACNSTSVPYWSDECGEKTPEISKLEDSFELFLKRLDFYRPRNYILNNLTLEKQASKLYQSWISF